MIAKKTPAAPAAVRTVARIAGLIAAVGYIRMSSDSQKDSPQRQRIEIEKLAERLGCYIVAWYEDLGISGTESLTRKQFQKMLRDAQGGKFKLILLSEQSRFSREDEFDVMEHIGKLRKVGVSLATSQDGIINADDLAGIIAFLVRANGARKESKNIAERSTTGRRLRLQRGERAVGTRTFGYDREITDDRGRVTRVSFRDKFTKPAEWKLRLVPSAESAAVAAVRFCFDQFEAGQRINWIARRLNERGVFIRTKGWDWQKVHNVLTCATYCGDTVVGRFPKNSRSKFFKVADGGVMTSRNTHEPLVSRAQFERVQSLLAVRPKQGRREGARLNLLAGLVRCACCGGPAVAWQNPNRGPGSRGYRCCARQSAPGVELCNSPSQINANELEAVVLTYVKARLDNPQVIADVRAAAADCSEQSDKSKAAELADELAAVRGEIKQAKENLARCKTASGFEAIEELLATWTAQEKRLQDDLQRIEHVQRLAPEYEKAVAELRALLADRQSRKPTARAADALAQLVASVRPRIVEPANGSQRRLAGRIEFHADCRLAAIEFDVPYRKGGTQWEAVRDYIVAAAGRVVRSKELREALGYKQKTSEECLRGAAYIAMRKSGSIARAPGGKQGWVAV